MGRFFVSALIGTALIVFQLGYAGNVTNSLLDPNPPEGALVFLKIKPLM